MKKIILFVAAILICLCATSCQKNTITTTVAPQIKDTEIAAIDNRVPVTVDSDSMKKKAVAALNGINSVDLGGKNFTIASSADMIYVPDSLDTDLSAAMDQRNRMFEKKYSTKLVQFTDDEEIMLKTARLNMLSGIYYTDLFSVPQSSLGRFAAEGILLKTTSVVGGDFSAEWYDSSLMNEVSHGTESYGIYGDFNRDISNYYCLYVNRDLLSAAGFNMPYDSVKNGSWTWDGLINMLRANTDINGTAGVASPDMGLLTRAVYKSGGSSFTGTGLGKEPTLAYNNESTVGIISLLRGIGGHKTLYNDTSESGSVRSDFMQGKSLFYLGLVGEMGTITTMKSDWCILPLPKTAASNSDYYSYISPDHAVICAYAGASAQTSADVIDGLYAASSGGYMTDAYYRELIATSIRDSAALDMLDYICGVKGGKAINDFTDIYTDYRANTVNALARTMYNYDLTLESILADG